MKKIIGVFVLVFAIVSSLFLSTEILEAKIKVMDHKGKAFGMKNPPEWVIASIESNTKVGRLYPGKQVFAMTQNGMNLQDLQEKMNTVNINAEVSRIAATSVVQNARNKAASRTRDSSAYLNASEFDTRASYSGVVMTEDFENKVHQASTSFFHGLIKEADWWILNRDGSKRYYICSVLYIMDKDLFEQEILKLTERAASFINDDTDLSQEIKNDNTSAVKTFDNAIETDDKLRARVTVDIY